MSKQSISEFVQLMVAYIKGDDAEAKALKIQKTARAEIKAQIAIKNAETLRFEGAIERAKESLKLAKFNHGELISDEKAYLNGLMSAKATLVSAEETLEKHLEGVKFLEEQLVEVNM